MGNMHSNPSNLIIYSHNVGGDGLSERMVEISGNKNMVFKKRFKALIKSLSNIDVVGVIDIVALNEIRHKENIDLVVKKLEELKYVVKTFANNTSPLTFYNVLALSKNSKWEAQDDDWKHNWVAYDDSNDKAYLKDEFIAIDGDPHGRCAGVVYLKNKKDPNKKAKPVDSGVFGNLKKGWGRIFGRRKYDRKNVCVLTSHVCPSGDVKRKQQNALFSLNQYNLDKNPSIPSILVGDFNRFQDEDLDFQERLKEYGLIEVKSSRLIIPDFKNPTRSREFSEDENIGTFNPWPSDVKIYHKKMKEPLKNSRLDVQLCTNNENLVNIKDTYTRASMFRRSSDPTSMTDDFNKVRHLLNCNMTSDHLAVIGIYEIQSLELASQPAL